MKFGKYLLAMRIQGWEDYYVDYKALQRCIKQEKAKRETELNNPGHSLEDSVVDVFLLPPPALDSSHELRREAGMNMEEEEMMALAEVSFAEEYLRQIELINLKFSEKVEEIQNRWVETNNTRQALDPKSCRSPARSHSQQKNLRREESLDPRSMEQLKRMQKEELLVILCELYKECMTIKQVCDLNLTGFSKALKKYKKSWGDKKDKKDKDKKDKKEKGNTLVRTNEGGGSRSVETSPTKAQLKQTRSLRGLGTLREEIEHEQTEPLLSDTETRDKTTDALLLRSPSLRPASLDRDREGFSRASSAGGDFVSPTSFPRSPTFSFLSRRSADMQRTNGRSFFLRSSHHIAAAPKDEPPWSNRVPQIDLKAQSFYLDVRKVEKVAQDCEDCTASIFTDGDKLAATRKLRHIHRQGIQKHFELGFCLGGCALTFVALLWIVSYHPPPLQCPYCTATLETSIPVYRVILLPIVWLWCWTALCFIWKEFSVNYPFIMAINPYSELGYDRCARIASSLSLVFLVNFTLFVGAVRTGYQPFGVPFYIYPISLLLFAFLALVAPKGTFHFKSRRYFFASLYRIVIAPFGPEVRFVDNYIADVLTSSAVFLRDLDYTIQFYWTEAFIDASKEVELNKVYWVSAPLITALPYWFRLQQCIRRFYDAGPGSKQRPTHLLNAGKYAMSLAATCIAALGNYSQLDFQYIADWEWGKVAWFMVLCVGTAYAYVWDITMDWGLIQRNEGGSWWQPFCLRRERIYPYKWIYYLAALLNLVGRLAWALTITPHSIFTGVPRSVSSTTIAVVELLRRAQWSLIRLEYEYTSNPSNYRSVKEVPMMLTTEPSKNDKDKDKEKNKTLTITSIVVGLVNTLITLVVLAVIYWYHNQHISPPVPPPTPTPHPKP